MSGYGRRDVLTWGEVLGRKLLARGWKGGLVLGVVWRLRSSRVGSAAKIWDLRVAGDALVSNQSGLKLGNGWVGLLLLLLEVLRWSQSASARASYPRMGECSSDGVGDG